MVRRGTDDLRGPISRDRRRKHSGINEQIAFRVRMNRRSTFSRRTASGESRQRLPDVGRECRDMDTCRYFRFVAGLGDDCAASGMSDQSNFAVLLRQRAPGCRNIGRERRQRVLTVDTV